ncbi:MAG: hypothetical protein JXN59_01335 [Anaerolineae bacterium]|nr:hypothetical protein [Anaerolineae bacterium]
MNGNSELDHDVLIRRLINALPCSECGSAYRWEDVFVVEEEAHSWTLVAFCPECGMECLVKAFIEDEETALPEEATALPEGVSALPADEPPDMAEVAAWGDFLASFEGDLLDLLRL